MSQTDWPAWVQAVGSVVAFASGAAVFALNRRDSLRAQAKQVYVNFVGGEFTEGVTHPGKAPQRTATSKFRVHNDSDGPIYDVIILARSWEWNSGDWPLENQYVFFKVLVAHEVSGDNQIDTPHPIEWKPDRVRPPLELRFTDAAGRRWRKRPDQRIERDRTPINHPFQGHY